MNKLQRIIGTGMIALAGLGISGCKEGVIEYSDVKTENAKVTWKEHKDAYSTMILIPMMIGKSMMLMPESIDIPEKNDIVFMGEQNFDLDNSEIFQRFKVGDKSKVSYVEKYWSTYDVHKDDGIKRRTLLKREFLENKFVDAQPIK